MEPHRRKNRSTGYRAESHRTIYHSTEPHRSMSYFSKTHRTIYITAPHRTVGFTISENRTERHLKISAFLKTVPNRTVRFSISENRTVYGRITVNNPGIFVPGWSVDYSAASKGRQKIPIYHVLRSNFYFIYNPDDSCHAHRQMFTHTQQELARIASRNTQGSPQQQQKKTHAHTHTHRQTNYVMAPCTHPGRYEEAFLPRGRKRPH